MTPLATVSGPSEGAAEPAIPPAVAARIAGAVESSQSAGTRRAYGSGWRRFTEWCALNGHVALPAHPVTVAAYLVDAADTVTAVGEKEYAASTLSAWLAALNYYHRTAGYPPPSAHELVAATLAGIRRDYAAAGDRPRAQRAPLLVSDIRHLVDTARFQCGGWADDVLERRDTALLLLGFAGAFRRSELADLECRDVTLHREDGLHIRLRKTKTDQEGRGVVRALPATDSHTTCPPCAYVRWVQVVSAFDAGGRLSVIRLLRGRDPFDEHVCRGGVPRTAARAPLFRAIAKNGNLGITPLSGAAIHKTIRRRAERANYDADLVAQLGGHSLRAGFVTQAFRNGADAHAIMRQTGHTTPAMLERYAREHAPLMRNAVIEIGL
ncbi:MULTISPECIES: site-specific integrase [Nocardiaceae]|uniref:Site-specific integrase n=1 Tax=Rhodococcoides kroppenstedtii TaxID=293050 RepID=A0ABS7NTX8_9NOCA|nr:MULTISPECIES: site-specific integrase [Rhodococcus]MBY6313515.1 site-specific integrase [Rhodococcus kroppenstedtii]MBY6321479.1 site-specific integrase [Rhodococcus kroppenstedtii]MBY6400177.1 site-specific integrase [Rhodococcus kroppenstedtii]